MFTLAHVAISVSNIENSMAFYSVFGFKKVAHWTNPDHQWQVAHPKVQQCTLEIFCFKDAQPAPASIHKLETDLSTIGMKHFALKVDSIEKTKQALQEIGLIDDVEIKAAHLGGSYFFVQDLQHEP